MEGSQQWGRAEGDRQDRLGTAAAPLSFHQDRVAERRVPQQLDMEDTQQYLQLEAGSQPEAGLDKQYQCGGKEEAHQLQFPV